ncbi:MAG: hypothetical protein CFE26_22215, partial [Verrucomicrobiales bacterium VVV1]
NDVAASGPITVIAGLDIVRNAGTLSSSAGIDLSGGGSIGSSGSLLQINPGTGLVSLTSNYGDIYVQQSSGTFNFLKYTVDAQGSTKEIVLKGAAIANSVMQINAPFVSDDNVSFIAPAASGSVNLNGDISGHTLNIAASGTGGLVFVQGASTLMATSNVNVFSLSGNVNLGATLTAFAPLVSLDAGGSITGGGSIVTNGHDLFVASNRGISSSTPFGNF